MKKGLSDLNHSKMCFLILYQIHCVNGTGVLQYTKANFIKVITVSALMFEGIYFHEFHRIGANSWKYDHEYLEMASRSILELF